MSGRAKDNLVLFPKTLDFYQIKLTKMLETERYGEAKALLDFLLQCGGEAEKHHTEWQALLGWLEAAFPEASASGNDWAGLEDDELPDEESGESDWVRRRVEDRTRQDAEYVTKLLASLREGEDPEQQLLAIGQLAHVVRPDVQLALKDWLSGGEHHPAAQFKALQALRNQGAAGPVSMWRDGEALTLEIGDTPLQFSDFPPAVIDVIERVRLSAEVSDPTLAYFAEEMWKECVQAAYGTPIYRTMAADEDGQADVWAAALHQMMLEKLHGAEGDQEIRDQYGITDELRFRYEQALRWLRQYAVEPRTAF
ncbi:hypothetical protein [Cohnella caldifontis]|uniref:hypothetical protein n=1 Tax=Cohnella caldifontis TaxID=3027471 RepID=UPI0023EBCA9C|nr:hypothetical protein [Cohnella sp. YIM B05605]